MLDGVLLPIVRLPEAIVYPFYFESEILLLMEEILHQLIGSLSHYLQGFIHPRWCRISSINSSMTREMCRDAFYFVRGL